MKKLTLKNAPPIIAKWFIKYDNHFQMPQYLQGKLVNDYKEFEASSNIILDDILSIDFEKKILTTYKNEVFILTGKGKTMYIVDKELPIEWDVEEEIDDDQLP